MPPGPGPEDSPPAAAARDRLTNLYDSGHFKEQLRVEMERARRSESSCSVIMIDLDNFKPVNDTYGHQTGDRLLQDVAALLRANVRTVDVLVRYGGDEFAIILPDTGARPALKLAQRIRDQFGREPRITKYQVTASLGLATFRSWEHNQVETLIERADQAMYKAKQQGGHQVWVWEGDLAREEPTEVTPAEKEALLSKPPDRG